MTTPFYTKSIPVAYIAGPMRNRPKFNFPAFDKAKEVLMRDFGFRVVSPADMDREEGLQEPESPLEIPENPSAVQMHLCLRRDFSAILRNCTQIVLLPGWEESQYAPIEAIVGQAVGCQVLELKDLWTKKPSLHPIKIVKWQVNVEDAGVGVSVV